VPATYNPDIMVCPREADANSYGDTASGSTGSPPRRCSTSSRRTSSSRHSRRGTGTTPSCSRRAAYGITTAPRTSTTRWWRCSTGRRSHRIRTRPPQRSSRTRTPWPPIPNGTICPLGVGW